MNTEQKFGYFNRHGDLPRKPKEVKGYGVLCLDGKAIEQPMTYALAQVKKREYINSGINPKRLKIRKHYEP